MTVGRRSRRAPFCSKPKSFRQVGHKPKALRCCVWEANRGSPTMSAPVQDQATGLSPRPPAEGAGALPDLFRVKHNRWRASPTPCPPVQGAGAAGSNEPVPYSLRSRSFDTRADCGYPNPEILCGRGEALCGESSRKGDFMTLLGRFLGAVLERVVRTGNGLGTG